MMGKKLLFAAIAAGLFIMSGCQNNIGLSLDGKIVDQTYNSILPCADCSGIDTTILVNQDGSYVMEQSYQGTSDDNRSFFESGTWSLSKDKLTLTNSYGEKSYYLPREDKLVMLDIDGNVINSGLNYTLAKVQPKQLAGEFTYFADAGTFKDCQSGRVYAADGLVLEKGYFATGVDGGTPVYLEVRGYYSIRPSMEDGQYDRALVVTDNKPRFDRHGSCNNRRNSRS
ncbi:TPA: envelope stress response activation lipoprotein NlpE [Proteus mirabilis]|uniref:envelope stress response activation lipoprotein NlpE n=1 Tax=Proteus mirabilis TaxID=584 RepID=UPI000D6FEAA0|nr:envelope stress response activation lipoprotein NlpE [Proteus mirabilis]EKW4026918.1 envelope stress response activation lipoprotein NlpE [Proteus mirabilis]EMC9359376.1 envelope stress response activation lipoprotein NlpE [Proteus mirabilis]EMD6182073.1 envelope stress response activation lipoprotein NlpE [Proteus mirabilis]MBG2743331.1 envelope stress response activation lipoprotein NlpE [Proteus mirabilis]MDF7210099.1 envelope stress response activation lipoprotein NlpE [Proteus mirabili